MQSLKNKEDQMVRIEETMFDDKCLELNVPATQKAVMKEIIGAAKTSAKGRRYTEEWIMLCMLMNIRSPGYYEFLRRNNVLPLPCTRTIRGYFSLINMKCGFEEFFCKQINNMFDALNRKSPNEGLTPDSNDFKVKLSMIFLIISSMVYLFIRCYKIHHVG